MNRTTEGEYQMQDRTTLSIIQNLMRDYASQTGLAPADAHPWRYLWTDAFAVCNYLELFRQTNDIAYQDLSLWLVDQVHQVLGRYRPDDLRKGWISGLSEEEGKRHPTRGGLRIGKELPERGPGDPSDPKEWDRDGQYYHYLTKWMHALCRVSRVTGEPHYNVWARELAKVAHARFTYTPRLGGRKRMYWKMSTDLTRPLITSMGQHDPLDGYVTYLELQTTATKDFSGAGPDLGAEIADMAKICGGMSLATDDPLGIGGLLSDASRIGQLMVQNGTGYADLLESILEASLLGLDSFARSGTLRMPAEYRLAFRELGFSVGLRGVAGLQQIIREHTEQYRERPNLPSLVEDLMHSIPLADRIEQFWLEPGNRETETWTRHQEINTVMLATSLAPMGFLSV
ncbi:MAG: hypothetical protein LUO93_03755 [Methanomicrobiales archaeon]|nr:hypothetical protein [Methanomicrobiales archaeon]